MPISPTDIEKRLSGGASNTVPAASLGGAKSSSAAPGNIFDDVDPAESAAGDVEFRCVYVHNAHATLTLTSAVFWMASNTPSPSTTVEVGVGVAAMNATEPAIANENTAPAGVSFAPAANQAAGIALGDIPPGQSRSVWLRRTIGPGTTAVADSFIARVTGVTAP